VRLGKRLGSLLHQLGGSIGGTIPFACQDWANTKAAYRFLSNDDVDEQAILAGHFQATRDRSQASSGPLLILQDTTEFSYKRDEPEAIGYKGVAYSRRDKAGRLRQHTTCGILMHSSLAVTAQGLPLGLCAIKFWSRQKFKGTTALKRKINPTRASRAFAVDPYYRPEDLGFVVPGGLIAWAHCINDRGQIAGEARTSIDTNTATTLTTCKALTTPAATPRRLTRGPKSRVRTALWTHNGPLSTSRTCEASCRTSAMKRLRSELASEGTWSAGRS
jgi:hypothetical protein